MIPHLSILDHIKWCFWTIFQNMYQLSKSNPPSFLLLLKYRLQYWCTCILFWANFSIFEIEFTLSFDLIPSLPANKINFNIKIVYFNALVIQSLIMSDLAAQKSIQKVHTNVHSLPRSLLLMLVMKEEHIQFLKLIALSDMTRALCSKE